MFNCIPTQLNVAQSYRTKAFNIVVVERNSLKMFSKTIRLQAIKHLLAFCKAFTFKKDIKSEAFRLFTYNPFRAVKYKKGSV